LQKAHLLPANALNNQPITGPVTHYNDISITFTSITTKQDHASFFSKLVKQTNHSNADIRVGLCCLTECLTGTFSLTNRDAGTKPLNRVCPGWNRTSGKL